MNKIKKDKPTSQLGKCIDCYNAIVVPGARSNPLVIHCSVQNKRFVADSPRKCFYARWKR